MKKKKERKKRITLAVIVVLIAVIAICISNGRKRSDAKVRTALLEKEWDFSGESEGTYKAYLADLEKNGKVKKTEKSDIEVKALEYSAAVPAECFEKVGDSIVTYAGGKITYEVNVPVSGTYNIEIGYRPTEDNNLSIIRNITVNDKTPFEEANGLVFDRMWTDENKDFLMKTDKNREFPSQVQKPEWTCTKLESSDRTVSGPFLFYFEKGNNKIALEAVQSTLEISYIKLVPSKGLVSYEEYLEAHKDAKKITAEDLSDNKVIMTQGEDTLYKSSSTLFPQNDRTSAATIPNHYSNIVLNTIGGGAWNNAGSNITWEVTVPKAGLYRIGARFMQTDNRDFFSGREIKINGEVPFKEASSIPFYYKSKFQVECFGKENEDYLFYLNEGKNTITLTVTLGDLAEQKEQAMIAVRNFNDLYRRLSAVFGSTPDTYRNYKIKESVKDLDDVLGKEYARLYGIMDSLGDSFEKNTKTTVISKFLLQIEMLENDPEQFAKQFKEFSNNITALAQWAMDIDKQPLLIDYIFVTGEDVKLPKAERNFFVNFGHSFMSFIGSFTNDYRIETETNKNAEKEIVVWISTSTRDQYDIAQRMINNAFKDADFKIELKMVGAGTVMPATLTGNGPDAAIQLDYSMPTNFAFRNAGYDLTKFDDFESVASRFAPGAMEYFKYNGGIYALPDEMSFPVMFVRTDILEKIGVDIPNTWDDVLGVIPKLQAGNMSMYFSYGTAGLGGGTSTSSKPISTFYMSKLYQNGIELYRNDGAECNLDVLDAEMVFKEWTEYYTKQSFALSISEITRFRTGEVPIFIDDYTVSNQIKAAAPEIEGAWTIVPIPGTIKKDGSIDRSAACMVGSCMIISTSVEKNDTADEAWTFLKWWTSKETQEEYARQQRSLLGDAGEFPIANVEAILDRAREKETYDTFAETIKWLRGVPQVPGGYITGREVENAFLSSVSNLTDPVDSLYAKMSTINNELKNKREEFGLEKEGGNK